MRELSKVTGPVSKPKCLMYLTCDLLACRRMNYTMLKGRDRSPVSHAGQAGQCNGCFFWFSFLFRSPSKVMPLSLPLLLHLYKARHHPSSRCPLTPRLPRKTNPTQLFV